MLDCPQLDPPSPLTGHHGVSIFSHSSTDCICEFMLICSVLYLKNCSMFVSFENKVGCDFNDSVVHKFFLEPARLRDNYPLLYAGTETTYFWSPYETLRSYR